MRVRLQRYLAQAGVASRRKSEDLIASGLVSVNGRVVTTPGTTVDVERDQVALRGRPLRPRFAERGSDRALTVALHKPAGVLTSRSDPRGRRTVYDLVREPAGERLAYVGRLDRETEGLLLLTTDGRLAHRLSHPRWEVERTYRADVVGDLDEERLLAGRGRGIALDDGRTAPYRARVLERDHSGQRHVELVLTEGRKREVRRILRACGGEVIRLVRTRFAFLTLDRLPPGRVRTLTRDEVRRLRALVDLEP